MRANASAVRHPSARRFPSHSQQRRTERKGTYGDAIRVLLANPLGFGLALVCSRGSRVSYSSGGPCCSLSERAGVAQAVKVQSWTWLDSPKRCSSLNLERMVSRVVVELRGRESSTWGRLGGGA